MALINHSNGGRVSDSRFYYGNGRGRGGGGGGADQPLPNPLVPNLPSTIDEAFPTEEYEEGSGAVYMGGQW